MIGIKKTIRVLLLHVINIFQQSALCPICHGPGQLNNVRRLLTILYGHNFPTE